jgi:hypothetical protein
VSAGGKETREVLVSVLTRKSDVSEQSWIRGHAAAAARQVTPITAKAVPLAQQAAQQAVPLAKQAVPLARSAGSTALQGADSAVAWATPLVEAARTWTAPQLEQAARAINESIAPTISDALISAAHKIDVPKRKRRQKTRLVVMFLLITAVGATAAAMAKRSREYWNGSASLDSGSTAASGTPGYDTDRSSPDPDMNGDSGQRDA